MDTQKSIPTTIAVLRRRPISAAYKICPLCDALNLKQNCTCYVCSWSGEFDHGQAMVNLRLQAVLESFPELSPVIYKRKLFRFPMKIQSIRKLIRMLFRKKLDFKV